MYYYQKYLKYKNKYLLLKNQLGAGCEDSRFKAPAGKRCNCTKSTKTGNVSTCSAWELIDIAPVPESKPKPKPKKR